MLCRFCRFQNLPGSTVCRSCGAPLAAEAVVAITRRLLVGTQVGGGRYAIGKVLGQDENSISYLGSELMLKRLVTIREFFPLGCARGEGGVLPEAGGWPAYAASKRRFLQDAQTLAQPRHPGLIGVFDTFEENNTAYVVTEHLEGRTLFEALQERGGPFDEREAVTTIEQVGGALDAAHRAGLVHQNIKPHHILLGAGRVVLLHFGMQGALATVQNGNNGASPLGASPPGASPHAASPYAAPEQFMIGGLVGRFSDIYGLAATLYHLLAGQPPVASRERACGVELPDVRRWNPAVSERTAQALQAGLAMDAAQRPHHVRALLDRFAVNSAATFSGNFAAQPALSAPFGTHLTPPVQRVQATSLQAAPVQASPVQVGTSAASAPASLRPGPDSMRALRGHQGRIASIAFSPGGQVLASASEDEAIILWDTRTAQPLRTLKGHGNGVRSVAFAPSGALLASGGESGEIILWDVPTGKPWKTLKGHRGRMSALAFSPAGERLASASIDATVMLWEMPSGKTLRTWNDHHSGVTSVAFSPDGNMLASGSLDESLKVRWVNNGTLLRSFRTPDYEASYEVTSVAFSPTGKTLAAGSYDKSVRMWDVSSGEMLWDLREHWGAVSSVTFSPNGKMMASGGFDKTVNLWDAWMGELKLSLTEHWNRVNAVAFSPDGKILASATHHEVWLWRIG